MMATQYGIDLGQVYGTVNALANQRQQQQLNALAIQKGQQDQDYRNALMAAPDDQARADLVAQRDPLAGLQLKDAQANFDYAKHQRDVDMTSRGVGAVLDIKDDSSLLPATQALSANLKSQGTPTIALDQAIQAAAGDPVKLRDNLKAVAAQSLSYADQLSNALKQRQIDMTADNTKAQREATIAYRQSSLDMQGKRLAEQERHDKATEAGSELPPAEAGQIDPNSNSILAQTGLSIPAFFTLTGQSSSLPRDKYTRQQAFAEAQQFANKKGVDVATLTSQYKALNDVLQKNIERVNQTGIMEGEIQGTIKNLQPVADAAGIGSLKVANLAKFWAGQQVNDPTIAQYGFQLNQLRSELAGYNSALRGNTQPDDKDYREAERIISNGLSSKAAGGLDAAVQAATSKMNGVLQRNVDIARKGVWDLFGVGKNYKPQYGAQQPAPPAAPASVPGATESKTLNGVTYHKVNGQWMQE